MWDVIDANETKIAGSIAKCSEYDIEHSCYTEFTFLRVGFNRSILQVVWTFTIIWTLITNGAYVYGLWQNKPTGNGEWGMSAKLFLLQVMIDVPYGVIVSSMNVHALSGANVSRQVLCTFHFGRVGLWWLLYMLSFSCRLLIVVHKYLKFVQTNR